MIRVYKEILDELPSGVWVTDREDKVVYINKAMTAIAGASIEEFTGLNVFKDMDNPGNKEFLESYRKVKRNLFPGEYEVRLKDSKGQGFVHRGWLTPLIKNCFYGGMIVTAEDITEKDIYLKAVKESEDKFRRTIEFAADGILLGSPEGYITEANQAVCELFGMDKKNMMQLHKMPFTKESLERYPMRFDLLKQGKTVISERVIKRKDGSEIMIEMKTKMMDDGSYQSIYRDITERKQNENALKENEEKFRTIFEESNDAIYLMDGDTFIDCNEQAVKMFECADRNEMINHKPMEFSPSVQPDGSESVPSALEHINEALAGRQQRFYWKHRKKNGQDFDAEVSLNAVFLKGKKFLQAIVKDITFRMEAEKEIKQINESLEQKIKERTAELEEAYKELESFSYSVSHDLRAPLRHISGFSDITRKNLSSGNIEKASNSLKKVEEATEKMEKLIDGLLKLSRTGRVELNMTELNMNGIIADVIDEYKDCPEYNAAEWHIRELPSVYADRTLMTSVWENLIDNALKYTGKNDDPKIEIGCNNSADRCEFYIKDNGVGFDPEFTNKLFGVFQRLHLDKEFRGTGIGLATVKRIIDRHGGTVRAEGETNKGATFYFTLPKVQGEK